MYEGHFVHFLNILIAHFINCIKISVLIVSLYGCLMSPCTQGWLTRHVR